MYEDPARIICRELQPGEQLLWAGQPIQGVRFSKSDFLLIPFSLFWGGFAIFWTVGVAAVAPFPVWLFGLPFVAIGLYLMVGRFFFDARKRAHTYYGVTDQRVLAVFGMQSRKINSLDLRSLPGLGLEERPDGRGTITFGPVAGIHAWVRGTGWPMPGQFMPMGFDTIEDARAVHDLIRDAQRQDHGTIAQGSMPYAQPSKPPTG